MQLPAWLSNVRLNSLILFIFCFLLYSNTITHEYTQDDAIVIYDNMFTTEGIEGIPGILKYDTFFGFFKVEGKSALVAGGRYRPLTLLMFALEVELFGPKPFIGHLMNIAWFGLCCVVLYLLLLKILQAAKGNTFAYFVALGAALLFAAHPVHTEAVANIKGRDEIITLLGSLSALYFSIRAFQEKKNLWNLLAGLLFFLALLAKENAITFLAIVPLTYFFFTKAKTKKILTQTAPFLLAAVVFLIIRSSVLGFTFSEPSLELMNNPFVKIEGNRYLPFTFGEKMATITYTLGKYIQLLIFPHPLTHDYYPRHIELMNWANWKVLLSLLTYLALTVYAIRGLLKKDIVSYGILFFLASLSIVSNIVFPIGTNMSERFIFMPSVGFCLIVAVLVFRLAKRRASNQKLTQFRQLKPYAGILLAVIILFSVKTFSRNFVWKDNYRLFTTDIQTSPNSAKLRTAAGGELVTQSLTETVETKKNSMLQEAVGHLQEAVRIHPNYKNAYLLLGNANNYLKQFEPAIQYYEKALQIDPDYKEARNNMSITYRDAGRHFGEQLGNLPKALEYLTKAYEINPEEYETLRLLGVAYGIKGDVPKTIEFFTKAVEVNPVSADALYNLGSAYYNVGNAEKGQEFHQKAIQIDPEVVQRFQK